MTRARESHAAFAKTVDRRPRGDRLADSSYARVQLLSKLKPPDESVKVGRNLAAPCPAHVSSYARVPCDMPLYVDGTALGRGIVKNLRASDKSQVDGLLLADIAARSASESTRL